MDISKKGIFWRIFGPSIFIPPKYTLDIIAYLFATLPPGKSKRSDNYPTFSFVGVPLYHAYSKLRSKVYYLCEHL